MRPRAGASSGGFAEAVTVRLRVALLLLLGAFACACQSGARPEPEPEPPPRAAATAAPKKGHVELVGASPEGDVAELVRAELARAKNEGRDSVVYVGAKWCDPCNTFHDAAEAGELDAEFPRLRMLVFDIDRDSERLEAAGYGSRMIPLFVRPEADGRGSAVRIEGSIKGPGATREIAPRLAGILGPR